MPAQQISLIVRQLGALERRREENLGWWISIHRFVLRMSRGESVVITTLLHDDITKGLG